MMIIIKFLQTNLTVHWIRTVQSCLGPRLDCHVIIRSWLSLRSGAGAGNDLSCRPVIEVWLRGQTPRTPRSDWAEFTHLALH